MDNLTQAQRSYNMSQIKSKNTKIEQKFFKILDENNIAYIKHPILFGKPDCQIKDNILIFINSDFWHGWHFTQWKNRLPKIYWREKIDNNIKRDKKKYKILKKMGYKVIRIWSHQLTFPKKVIRLIKG